MIKVFHLESFNYVSLTLPVLECVWYSLVWNDFSSWDPSQSNICSLDWYLVFLDGLLKLFQNMNLSYFLFKKQISLPRYVLYKECYVVLQPLLLTTHFPIKHVKPNLKSFPFVCHTFVFSSMYSFDAICQVVCSCVFCQA